MLTLIQHTWKYHITKVCLLRSKMRCLWICKQYLKCFIFQCRLKRSTNGQNIFRIKKKEKQTMYCRKPRRKTKNPLKIFCLRSFFKTNKYLQKSEIIKLFYWQLPYRIFLCRKLSKMFLASVLKLPENSYHIIFCTYKTSSCI